MQEVDDFCPLREPGPHIPNDDVCVLSLFELFFDDWAMERMCSCTLVCVESKRTEKKKHYEIFMRRSLTKEELMAFIGALILLGINPVRNHRKAWSCAPAQGIV